VGINITVSLAKLLLKKQYGCSFGKKTDLEHMKVEKKNTTSRLIKIAFDCLGYLEKAGGSGKMVISAERME
jgi:hypothetical protein